MPPSGAARSTRPSVPFVSRSTSASICERRRARQRGQHRRLGRRRPAGSVQAIRVVAIGPNVIVGPGDVVRAGPGVAAGVDGRPSRPRSGRSAPGRRRRSTRRRRRTPDLDVPRRALERQVGIGDLAVEERHDRAVGGGQGQRVTVDGDRRPRRQDGGEPRVLVHQRRRLARHLGHRHRRRRRARHPPATTSTTSWLQPPAAAMFGRRRTSARSACRRRAGSPRRSVERNVRSASGVARSMVVGRARAPWSSAP